MTLIEKAFTGDAMANLLLGSNRYEAKVGNSNELPTKQAQSRLATQVSIQEAAEALQVGRSSIRDARAIRQHAPELVEPVRTGKLPLRPTADKARRGKAGGKKRGPIDIVRIARTSEVFITIILVA